MKGAASAADDGGVGNSCFFAPGPSSPRTRPQQQPNGGLGLGAKRPQPRSTAGVARLREACRLSKPTMAKIVRHAHAAALQLGKAWKGAARVAIGHAARDAAAHQARQGRRRADAASRATRGRQSGRPASRTALAAALHAAEDAMDETHNHTKTAMRRCPASMRCRAARKPGSRLVAAPRCRTPRRGSPRAMSTKGIRASSSMRRGSRERWLGHSSTPSRLAFHGGGDGTALVAFIIAGGQHQHRQILRPGRVFPPRSPSRQKRD